MRDPNLVPNNANVPSERTILKALVGSRAHGLANENSDSDYRGVFVVPTSEFLRIGGHTKRTAWIERDESGAVLNDNVSWEVGHFLYLATKCNPSILECLAAPVFDADGWGLELRALLPCVWNPQGVRDAFVGYALSQRQKMLEDKDKRPWKYACAYLRTLAAGEHLLRTGEVLVDMTGHETHGTLARFKDGDATKGDVINVCELWTRRIEDALTTCEHQAHLAPVNEFLLRLRYENWGH